MLKLYLGRIEISVPVLSYFIGVCMILLKIFFTPSDTCFHSGYVNIGRWVRSSLFDIVRTRVSKFVHLMSEWRTMNSLSGGNRRFVLDAAYVLISLELLMLRLELISYFVLPFYEISSSFFLNYLKPPSLVNTAREAP